MRKRKPIEGNRTQHVAVSGADARAMEVAALAMEGDNVTMRQAEAAGRRLTDVSKRFREADRNAARRVAREKKK